MHVGARGVKLDLEEAKEAHGSSINEPSHKAVHE